MKQKRQGVSSWPFFASSRNLHVSFGGFTRSKPLVRSQARQLFSEGRCCYLIRAQPDALDLLLCSGVIRRKSVMGSKSVSGQLPDGRQRAIIRFVNAWAFLRTHTVLLETSKPACSTLSRSKEIPSHPHSPRPTASDSPLRYGRPSASNGAARAAHSRSRPA